MELLDKGEVLIVEDDRKISALVGMYLQREGFRTTFAYDGAVALALLDQTTPDLIVLDLMLPSLDGWQICRSVRASSDAPIVMLTAKGEEAERVLGLTLGADDYVVKPFSPRELVERVKAVLRRVKRGQPDQQDGRFTFGELTIDVPRHSVLLDGAPVGLTASEFTLLAALIAKPGQVVSRRQLMRHLYPAGEEVVDNVVDVHIGKLRQKLESGGRRRWIRTVRGVGFQFVEEAQLA